MRTHIRDTRNNPNELSQHFISTFNTFMKNGFDINRADDDGFTPLALATCHNEIINIRLVELLLNNNANPNLAYGRNNNLVATLLYLYFDDYFNCYMTDERINELTIFYQNRNDAILTTMKLLINHGLNLDTIIDPPPGTNIKEKISVIDFMKQQIEENRKYYEESVKKLEDILDYYAKTPKKTPATMKPF